MFNVAMNVNEKDVCEAYEKVKLRMLWPKNVTRLVWSHNYDSIKYGIKYNQSSIDITYSCDMTGIFITLCV